MTNDDGLDFETGIPDEAHYPPAAPSQKKNPDLKDSSRHAFRFPIPEIGTVKVLIGDNTFDVVNIVVNDTIGIGVRLLQGDIFSVNEELPQIRLQFHDKDFKLAGKVQHISPDVSGHYICGILLFRLTAEDRQALKTFAQTLHSELFR